MQNVSTAHLASFLTANSKGSKNKQKNLKYIKKINVPVYQNEQKTKGDHVQNALKKKQKRC